MNYLGHAVFSFGHTDVLVGNAIADFVKGKSLYTYPDGIQAGIQLHRAIDSYTDAHPAVKEAALLFKKDYRLYSAVFTDVLWDYFLANDENFFTEESLLQFSLNVYHILQQQQQYLPPKFAAIFPYMQQHNWLYNYRTHSGMAKSFGGLVHRSAYMYDAAPAFQTFVQHEVYLAQLYRQFIPDVKFFAKKRCDQILG